MQVPRAPRLDYHGPARVVTAQTTINCRLVNISATGVLVTLPSYCRPERRVYLSFQIDRSPLQLEGVVARACRVNAAHAWGISFRRTPDGVKQLLSHYVRCRIAAARAQPRPAVPAPAPSPLPPPPQPPERDPPTTEREVPTTEREVPTTERAVPRSARASPPKRAGAALRRRWARTSLEQLYSSLPPRKPKPK